MTRDKGPRRLAAQLIYHIKRAEFCLTALWQLFKDRDDDYPEVVAGLGIRTIELKRLCLMFIWAAWELDEEHLESYRGVTKEEVVENEE
jgi:hypothetical protein